MENERKELQLNQLKALLENQVQTAESQKLASGRVSPEAVSEIYRLWHQIKATIEDRALNMQDPEYLKGLYESLLRLHRENERIEKILSGMPTPDTIAAIARFEYMLEELKKQERDPNVSGDGVLEGLVPWRQVAGRVISG